MAEDEAVTAEEFETWLSPAQTIARFPDPGEEARNRRTIETYLATGQIRSVAHTAVVIVGSRRQTRRLVELAPQHWSHDWHRDDTDFWQASQVVLWKEAGRSRDKVLLPAREIIATGVRFDLAAIDALWPRAQLTPIPTKGRPGAPRKGWWDDLWIEMIRRMEGGNLTPATATELEGIMEDWCIDSGFSPGESTLKPASLKLFKYLGERGGK